MVQIIPRNDKVKSSDAFISGLSQTAPDALENFVQTQKKQQQEKKDQKTFQDIFSKENQDPQDIITGILTSNLSPNAKKLGIETMVQQLSATKPKAPLGGLTGQPTPPEVSSAISQIVNEGKDLTADELAVKFDESSIPRAYSNSYIENRRRQDESKAKQDSEQTKNDRKEAIQFHKESQDFDKSLTTQSEAAEKKIKSIQQQRKLQPNITNWDRFVTAAFKNSPWENLFKSSTAQQFDSFALPMIEGQKDTFGVRLSDADLKLILQKIATADKNPEANAAIMDWMEEDEKLKIERRKIADQITKQNKGLRPQEFESLIRQEMQNRFGNEIDEKAKKILDLPENEDLKEKVTGRRKVPEGTKTTDQILDRYLKLAYDDFELASEMAAEDGYRW